MTKCDEALIDHITWRCVDASGTDNYLPQPIDTVGCWTYQFREQTTSGVCLTQRYYHGLTLVRQDITFVVDPEIIGGYISKPML